MNPFMSKTMTGADFMQVDVMYMVKMPYCHTSSMLQHLMIQ